MRNQRFKIEGMGDIVNKRIVVNLLIMRTGILTEFNLSERQACKVMAEITKAMSDARRHLSKANGVDKTVCRKIQGKAEEGNTCLQTPGTCESCPDWGIKRPAEHRS